MLERGLDRLRNDAYQFVIDIDRNHHSDQFQLLDGLDRLTAGSGLHVFAAWQVPNDPTNWSGYVDGQNVFRHHSVSSAFLAEWQSMVRTRGPSALARMAWQNRGPFTFTECMRATKATGGDRWIFDLAAKHRLRDGLYCPVGVSPLGNSWGAGLWVVAFWSPKIVRIAPEVRAIIHCVSVRTAHRLEELTGHTRQPRRVALSARELTVLQALSYGNEIEEIADMLMLSVPTVRTFLRRAQRKLNAKTRTQAVVEAMRRLMLR